METSAVFKPLVPGIYAVHNRWVEGKSGLLLTDEGTLVIDTCGYADEGEAIADFCRQQGNAPCRVMLTHGHGDHILGSAPFRGRDTLAHLTTPDVIRRHLPTWAERAGESPAELRERLVWPNITFDGMLRLELGGKHVRLFHTPGHSQDSCCAYVEEDGILFAGDTVVTGIVPAIADGDSRALEASLRHLAGMEIEVLVPGHGPVVRGAQTIRDWLITWADYVARLRAAVRVALSYSDNVASLVTGLSFEEYVGDRLPAERYNMVGRHRNTVQKIIAEELARRA